MPDFSKASVNHRFLHDDRNTSLVKWFQMDPSNFLGNWNGEFRLTNEPYPTIIYLFCVSLGIDPFYQNPAKGDFLINQFIVNAVAEKISALKTESYLQEPAEKGSRSHALSMLDQVADISAEPQDQLK